MGLRFRKSVKIAPGLRLNFNTKGMSLSAGIPGFHKTINTDGQMTTSVGIPGSGLYYVDTKKVGEKGRQRRSSTRREGSLPSHDAYGTLDDSGNHVPVAEHTEIPETFSPAPQQGGDARPSFPRMDRDALRGLHRTCDDAVDWTEVLASPAAPDGLCDQRLWGFYRGYAPKVLAGDIDAYLELIEEVNPLDDLMPYGSSFEFGTDDPFSIEVEFTFNEGMIDSAKAEMDELSFNDLLLDYACSICVRIARDMMALLPVEKTAVHAVSGGDVIMSVLFDRERLSKLKLGFADPSDIVERFPRNLDFTLDRGFRPVSQITA